MSGAPSDRAPWVSWITDNLLAGVPATEVRQALVDEGADETEAAAWVADVVESPIFRAARPWAVRARRHKLVAELHADLFGAPHAQDPPTAGPGPLAPPLRSAGRLGLPLSLPGFCAGWPARERWQPAALAARFPDARVEVTDGRDDDDDYDRNWRAHRRERSLGDFLDDVATAAPTNRTYLTANNRALERPPLDALLDDVVVPEDVVDRARLAGSSSLWIGPAGTRTPLHHDTCSILFCQVIGRKRFTLFPAGEPWLLENADGLYSHLDLRDPDTRRDPAFDETRRWDLVVDEGDALFLPVGVWHEVFADTFSISFSFTGLRWRNRFDDYGPGRIV